MFIDARLDLFARCINLSRTIEIIQNKKTINPDLHNNLLIFLNLLCIIKLGEVNESDNQYRAAGKAQN